MQEPLEKTSHFVDLQDGVVCLGRTMEMGGGDKNANIISELKKFFIQKSLKVADTRYI